MRLTLLICGLLITTTLFAANPISPMFHSPNADMIYPDVAGDYLVYSQRVHQRYQVMRLSKHDIAGAAKDISATSGQTVIRFGVALENGDIAYISNRLGYLTPWLSLTSSQQTLAPAIFHNGMLPNHLQATADGQTWVFDNTFENTRRARINSQQVDGSLHHQLLGQAWRMYHEKYWAFRNGYPESTIGVTSKFQAPRLFTFSKDKPALRMLGDGFDADISHDGKKIVFVRENNGNFDLWLQNSDGSGLKRLTRNPYADLEPTFNADATKIAFVSNRDSLGDIQQTFIYTLDLNTGTQHVITSGLGVIDGGPAWLNDETLIFHSNRNPQLPQADPVQHWSLWTVKIAD
ncbi:MAG: hypothetical protein Q9M19_09295 [Mariprofundaceae bacterium]|nr:hypothetical protein [Mariprofundaceae bacterium]